MATSTSTFSNTNYSVIPVFNPGSMVKTKIQKLIRRKFMTKRAMLHKIETKCGLPLFAPYSIYSLDEYLYQVINNIVNKIDTYQLEAKHAEARLQNCEAAVGNYEKEIEHYKKINNVSAEAYDKLFRAEELLELLGYNIDNLTPEIDKLKRKKEAGQLAIVTDKSKVIRTNVCTFEHYEGNLTIKYVDQSKEFISGVTGYRFTKYSV